VVGKLVEMQIDMEIDYKRVMGYRFVLRCVGPGESTQTPRQ
jgi:hypothetical protein